MEMFEPTKALNAAVKHRRLLSERCASSRTRRSMSISEMLRQRSARPLWISSSDAILGATGQKKGLEMGRGMVSNLIT